MPGILHTHTYTYTYGYIQITSYNTRSRPFFSSFIYFLLSPVEWISTSSPPKTHKVIFGISRTSSNINWIKLHTVYTSLTTLLLIFVWSMLTYDIIDQSPVVLYFVFISVLKCYVEMSHGLFGMSWWIFRFECAFYRVFYRLSIIINFKNRSSFL